MTDINDKIKNLTTQLYDIRTVQLKDKHTYIDRTALQQLSDQLTRRIALYTLGNCILLLSTIIIII